MQNATTNSLHAPSLRIGGSITAGAAITFSIFVLMHELIAQDGGGIEPPTELVMVDPFLTVEDPKTIEKHKIKPIEPPKKMPEQLRPELEITPDDNQPNVNVDIQPPTTSYAKTEQVFSLIDGESRPIFRMAPKYPTKAAQDGLEGWVELEFTIDASGAVKDIRVIDAEPKRIFDREARRALQKWKYKPLVVDGQPIEQPNRMVVLDFKLES